MKKNKILFFVKETRGGTGTFLNQISLLNEDRFEKIFYFFKKDKYLNFRKCHSFINFDYPQEEGFSLIKFLIFLKSIFKTYKTVLKERPNLLFVCDLYSFILLSGLKIFFKKSLLLFYFVNIDPFRLIEYKPNFFYRLFLIKLYKNLLANVDLFIFPSKNLARSLGKKLNLDKKKVKVIPHGIDIELVNKLIKKRVSNKEKEIFLNRYLKIVSIGRLSAQKDFFTLFKAFSLLIKKKLNVVLVVIGDGELKNELIKTAENLNIKEKVYFLGWKQNIFPYLKSSDIFVFSSFFEGFGMVILEAMASQVPVIATDTPYGPSEILDCGKYGGLVPIGNAKIMAMKIERLLKNKSLRNVYIQRSYNRVKEFSLKKIIDSYEKILLEAINEQKN